MGFSYRVHYPLFVYFCDRGIFSIPEALKPVLQPRTALYCGDELL